MKTRADAILELQSKNIDLEIMESSFCDLINDKHVRNSDVKSIAKDYIKGLYKTVKKIDKIERDLDKINEQEE